MSTAEKELEQKLDSQLAQTNDIRFKVIHDLTHNKTTGQFIVPDDPKIQSTLLKALDGVDKNALGIKRIKVEDKAAESNAAVAGMIAELYKEVGHRERNNTTATEVPTDYKPPALGADIPPPPILEGQTAVGVAQDSYESFMGDIGGASPNEAPRF